MNNKAEIDDYIKKLEYNSVELLTYNGSKITNFKPKTGKLNGNEFVVTEREKYTIENDINVCILDLNQLNTYPGALVYIDSNLADGSPNIIPIDRGSASISLNLPNSVEDIIEITEVKQEHVMSGINGNLIDWYNNKDIKHSIPAVVSYQSGLVKTESEMIIKFGCSAQFSKNQLGIDFNDINHESNSIYMVMYKQVFYTASVDVFTSPSDAFEKHVTIDDVKQLIDNDRVPGYIQGVSYGREIFFKFESECSDKELETAIDAFFSKYGVKAKADLSADIKATLEKTRCSMVILGGNSKHLDIMLSDDDISEKINKIIFTDVTLSMDNPAYPLMYKTVFLKDSINAVFHGSTEYTIDKVTKYNSGEIQLKHSGAYIARFIVTWDIITDYDQNGDQVLQHCAWDQNGHNKTVGFSTVIPLPANACNIHIKCEGMTGIIGDNWHVSFDKMNIPLMPEITVKVSGTTLNQKVSTNIK